jgi:RNA polymerase sigma-54 factor
VSKAILTRQEAFFSCGPSCLSPLRLTDIAEMVGVHESTVSRAVSKKYLQCSWGVYPMSFFFSREVASRKGESPASPGQSMTSSHIKEVLREIIDGENKKKPYSDRLLSEKLEERGISISRRTVAKYREEEGICDASGRKEYT